MQKFVVFSFAFLLAGIWAKPTVEQQSSNGTSSLQTCLEKINSEVCDPAGVLSQEQMQKLNDALNQMEKQTSQEGYAFDKTQREKCVQKGITMAIVLLKEDSQDLSATEKMLMEKNREYTQKNPCERVAIMMLNTGDKIEQRRFWAGRNWNVNVEPSEMVQFYQKEIPLIQKADYMQALLNMLQQFSSLISKRPGPLSSQKFNQQKNQQQSAPTTADQQQNLQKTEMVKAEEGPMEGQKAGEGVEEQKKQE